MTNRQRIREDSYSRANWYKIWLKRKMRREKLIIQYTLAFILAFGVGMVIFPIVIPWLFSL